MRRIDRTQSERGFTLVEVSILLTVVVILSASIAPVLSTLLAHTRLSAVHNEMAAIAQALQQFLDDIGCDIVPQNNASSGYRSAGVVVAPFTPPPVVPAGSAGGAARVVSELRAADPCSATNLCGGDPVELLVSAGDTPSLGPLGDQEWVSQPDGEWVDFIEYYLISNTPGNDAGRAFPALADCYEVLESVRAWRGAYLNVGGGDPWGNRYMINTALLASSDGEDVVILSAGPDQEVDSEFFMDGFVSGDDDVALLFSAGR